MTQATNNGFHFGIEAEFMLADGETFRPLWPQDVTFAELNAVLESIPFDEALFERLRALRKEIADDRRVRAFVVFHDSVLKELARARPTVEQEFASVRGVGPAKLAAYGARFLAEIASYTDSVRGDPVKSY